jgi:type 1 glutamine amidotransferase
LGNTGLIWTTFLTYGWSGFAEGIVRRREFIALLGGAAAIRPFGAHAERPPERILYFTYSAGYRHDVIPLSKAILTQLGSNSGVFEVTATDDTSEFSAENLERYAAVMFYTSGELPMSDAQKIALLNFVRSGRGFLGVHSATDTFYTWPDYLDLVGGYFNGHPWHQAVTIEVVDPGNPQVAFLGNSFQVEDEIYQISDFDYRGSRVLLRLDPSSVDLGKIGVHQRFYGWPLAWNRLYGEGRVFYTALGHEPSVWQDARYQRIPRTLSSGLCEGRPSPLYCSQRHESGHCRRYQILLPSLLRSSFEERWCLTC